LSFAHHNFNKDNSIKINEIRTLTRCQGQNGLSIDDKLLELVQVFNAKSLCSKNGMVKHKGYAVSEIFTVLILFISANYPGSITARQNTGGSWL